MQRMLPPRLPGMPFSYPLNHAVVIEISCLRVGVGDPLVPELHQMFQRAIGAHDVVGQNSGGAWGYRDSFSLHKRKGDATAIQFGNGFLFRHLHQNRTIRICQKGSA